jgi:hypothetical protein
MVWAGLSRRGSFLTHDLTFSPVTTYTGSVAIKPPCQLANVEIHHGGGAVELQRQSHAWAGQPPYYGWAALFVFWSLYQ